MKDTRNSPVPIDALLEPVLTANRLPAVAAAVAKSGGVVAVGSIGLRKAGAPERVTKDDKWHIGSCTKSMTAVLAAMLVDEGVLRWNTTLVDALPELAPQMQPGWRGVTLEQLLTHRGGAPPDLNRRFLWRRLWLYASDDPLEQRAYLARELLTKEQPLETPGMRFVYSSAGCALVGHIIEMRVGTQWEKALRDRLFSPLGMTSAGFGAPASPGKVDQPWGHLVGAEGQPRPIRPGLRADNPAAIGPAGSVHCSITDLAKYEAFQLRGALGKGELLEPATFKKLQTRAWSDSDLALGWLVTNREWGGGDVLTHAGSNTMNYAVIWLAPRKDFAVAVCTNVGGEVAARASNSAAETLIHEFLVGRGSPLEG